ALEQEREAKRKLESRVCSLMQEVERLKEGRTNERPAPANQGGAVAEATQPGSARVSALQPEEGEEGNVLARLRRMVSKPLIHVPSLALDNPLAVDGVLRRPCEHEAEERRDASPDRNDTDSLSAYEDASAETPERDELFPGTAETELPRDPEGSAQVGEDQNQEPKAGEQCVVS
ncbi:unnamed protein product, partial [Tetraodon nigroviridis]